MLTIQKYVEPKEGISGINSKKYFYLINIYRLS